MTSKKITKLTVEQEQQLTAERDDWLRIGRSTEPIDEAAAKEIITDFYRRIGKPAPRFLVFDSPQACCIATPLFLKMLGRKDDRPLNEQAQEIYRAYYAQDWWSSWVAFYRFGEKIGVKFKPENAELLAAWERLTKACHWFFPFEHWCILSRRPTKVEIDQQGRIHGGVEYVDGTGVWAHHGIRVPREAVRAPGWVTVKRIEDEKNSEVRRAYIEIYGTGKYLLDSGAEQLHRDEFGILYRKGDIVSVRVLNSTPEPNGTLSAEQALEIFGKARWWKPEFAGQRFKEYFLDVHPDLCPLLDPVVDGTELGAPQKMTARNAVASTFGMRGEDYQPAAES